jgi:23S rRNA (cytosine1962-C5)-methyltransferase
VGGWGIQAAVAGASEVTCVDSSSLAIEYVQKNAMLNQVADKTKTICGDVFDVLSDLIQKQSKFDVIILDPPAFVKRRKDAKQGLQAYFRVNQQAVKLLSSNGIIISASCSHHLARSDLQEVLRFSFHKAGRMANILYSGQQAPDHPIQLAMPETDYLKAFFVKAD